MHEPYEPTLQQAIVSFEAALSKSDANRKTLAVILATLSQQLGYPLDGIARCMALLAQTSLTPPQRELVDTARRSSKFLSTFAERAREIATTDEDPPRPKAEAVDPVELILESLAPFFALASSKQVSLSSQVDADIPSLIWVDPFYVKSILVHLVGGAIERAPHGTVQVQVYRPDRTQAEVAGAIMIRIEVKDSGPEVNPNITARTETLTGVEAILPTSGEGAHDLAHCSRLVRAMGGRLRVDRGRVGGSRFYFDLRLQSAYYLAVDRSDLNTSAPSSLGPPAD